MGDMNEDLALFPSDAMPTVVETLRHLGYAIANPSTREVRGWNSEGDLVLLPTEEEGVQFLQDGTGLQLWRNDGESLFVGNIGGRPSVSFDGLDDSAISTLIGAWKAVGLQFELLVEEELPDAVDQE